MDNLTGVENVPAELVIVPFHVPAMTSVLSAAGAGVETVPTWAVTLKAMSSWKSGRAMARVSPLETTETEPRTVVPSLVL